MSFSAGVTIKILEEDDPRIRADCQLYQSGPIVLKGKNESANNAYPYSGAPRLTKSVKKKIGKMPGGKTHDRAVFSVKAHEIPRYQRLVIMVLEKVKDTDEPKYADEYNLRFVIVRALREANDRKMETVHIPTIDIGYDKLLSFCIIIQSICLYFETCGNTDIKNISILCSEKQEYKSIMEFLGDQSTLQPNGVSGFLSLRTYVEKNALLCEEEEIPRRNINMDVPYATFVDRGYFIKRRRGQFSQDSSRHTSESQNVRDSITMKPKKKIRRISYSSNDDLESDEEKTKSSTSSESDELYDPIAVRKRNEALRRIQRRKLMKKKDESHEGSMTLTDSVRSNHAERQSKYREKKKQEKDNIDYAKRRLMESERIRQLRNRQSEDEPTIIERRRLMEVERKRQSRRKQTEDDPAEIERRRKSESERLSQWRINQADDDSAEVERRRLLGSERKRRWRIRQTDELTRYDSDEEPSTIDGTITFDEAQDLGPRNNICHFCNAIHFEGYHACCQGGKVFVPPFPKLPEPIFSLLYDVNNARSRKRRKEFLSKILQYNSFLSFASIQYTNVPVAPHGVPAAKVQGILGHYVSAAEPNNLNFPRFGNYYLYEGTDAMEQRKRFPYPLARLDEEIVTDVSRCIETFHPFARYYKKMGDLMKEQREKNLEPLQMRMKIVDPFDYQHDYEAKLEGHTGIYATEQSKDYVALFYNANIDQDLLPRGLIIYPKLGENIPKPLYHWLREVNSLCYPILFPHGEPGYFPKGYYREDAKTYSEHLEQYLERMRNLNKPNPEATWDSDHEIHQEGSRSDPNLESELSGNEEENVDERHYDLDFNQTIATEEVSARQPGLDFVARHGERYPVRRPTGTRIDSEDSDRDSQESSKEEEDQWNSGDDEIDEEEAAGLLNSQDRRRLQDSDEHQQVHADSNVTEENADEFARGLDDTTAMSDQEEHEDDEEERDVVDDIFEGRRRRQFASMRDWTLHVSQDRQRFRNRVSAGGKLGQLFVIDMHSRIMNSRMTMIRKHHTQFMTSTRKRLLESFQRTADRHNRKVGSVTTIPASVPGSPRHLQKKYEEAVQMCNKLGKPDLFITFTANTNWPEIKKHIPEGHTWADHPFLVNEVFYKKMNKMLRFVTGMPICPGSRVGLDVFGGSPLIVSLVNHIKTVQQVDAVCSAELPVVPDPSHKDYKKILKLRELSEQFMVHTPCEKNPQAYCKKGTKPHWKTCRKKFPKEFSDHTEYGDRDYPRLKRPENGEFVMKRTDTGMVKADNRHVVAYNKDLLMWLQSHINVEVISSIRELKYIFKYLFKGFDRALVECIEDVSINGTGSFGGTGQMTICGNIIHPKNLKLPSGSLKNRMIEARELLRRNGVPVTDENGSPMVVYDETHTFMDLRAVTANEAAWEIAGYDRTGASHTVVTTYSHLPHEETVSFEMDADEETLRQIALDQEYSRFTAWFKLNAGTDYEAEEARELTFDELPKKFKFSNGKWTLRRHDWSHFVLGRVKFVRPRYLESFAVRLLAQSQKGVTSFEELGTVNGILYPSFVEAAKALRLMNSEIEWDECLEEASSLRNPTPLRRLFVSILLYCAPANPLDLWNRHKAQFFTTKHWSLEKKEAQALYHIRSGLRAHGMELSDFNLPEVNVRDLPIEADLVDDSKEKELTQTETQIKGDELFEKLTEEQKTIVETVIASVTSDEQSFFIEGSGGCGKTLVYETIYYRLQGMGLKVLCVAHTGVAASLLPNGQTAHRAFGIPLTVETNMTCKIEFGTAHEAMLDSVCCVLWDEATMTDRRIYDSVDRLFQVIKNNQRPFGGINFCFGGDWRQTLPIVADIHGDGVVDYTLRRSELWPRLKVLHLNKNMRAKDDPEYAKWIKMVGEGKNFLRDHKDEVQLIDSTIVNTERTLIEKIFGGGRINNRNVTSSSCILTVDNLTSLEINQRVLKQLPGEERVMLSRDEYDPQRGFAAILPEMYNNITPSGMPPHKLPLKVGAVVILLRNLNVFLGLCNGLRMWVTAIGDDLVTCEPINGSANTPKTILLHRMAMSPTHSMSRELAFIRWQFPVRLAYSMTVNKAQGQTLDRVGLLLRTPVFSHGQLYVALSRVRNSKSLFIYNATTEDKKRTRNVVYKSVF